jgi:FkbM family methyltransferase
MSSAAFVDRARSLVEQFPVLQRPAHVAYSTMLKAKNLVVAPLFKFTGYLPQSLSDRGQDAWVVEIFGGKLGGFFLEAGAADGFSESNTFVLEKRYGWKGICVEPNPALFDRLIHSGRTCICLNELIDSGTGTVEFASSGQESGIISSDTDNSLALRKDYLTALRKSGMIQMMKTKPLADILAACKAPQTIDYFSFDVEGSETRILRNFPFDRYVFLSMTIERPTPELNSILFANGYSFVKNSLYDTFYVHRSHPNFSNIEKMPFAQIPPKNI